jgi:hypothetical protein
MVNEKLSYKNCKNRGTSPILWGFEIREEKEMEPQINTDKHRYKSSTTVFIWVPPGVSKIAKTAEQTPFLLGFTLRFSFAYPHTPCLTGFWPCDILTVRFFGDRKLFDV